MIITELHRIKPPAPVTECDVPFGIPFYGSMKGTPHEGIFMKIGNAPAYVLVCLTTAGHYWFSSPLREFYDFKLYTDHELILYG